MPRRSLPEHDARVCDGVSERTIRQLTLVRLSGSVPRKIQITKLEVVDAEASGGPNTLLPCLLQASQDSLQITLVRAAHERDGPVAARDGREATVTLTAHMIAIK